MGLLSFILTLMAGVGFAEAVHGTLANKVSWCPQFVGQCFEYAHCHSRLNYDFKPLLQRDLMATPIPLRRFESRSNYASFPFQKVNQHCLGVVTRASGSTILGASNFLDLYIPFNIHSRIQGSGTNSIGYESGAN